MKRLILLCAFAFALFLTPVYAQASEGNPASHVTITVVMPEYTPAQEPAPFPSMPTLPGTNPEPAPVSAPIPEIPKLYPTGVLETLESGRRWIIKTYELKANEDPADIPRGNFERDGWDYSLTDITKRETAATDVRDHKEIITVNTETKDMEAILRLLAQTVDFTSEDGYTGLLTLDVSSITVETAGTRTTSFTASATREYPHLSSNDTSLLPKSITDGGRTLSLAAVDWKTNYTMTVDYEQIPASYTAVATYTAPASRTVVTGYITTAEYKGQLARLNQGLTVYTAYFAGKEIVPERIPLEIVQPTTTPAPTPEPEPAAEPDPEPDGEPGAEPEPVTGEEADSKGNPLLIIIPALLFALLIGLGAGYYVPRIIKNKKEKGDTTA